AVDAGAEAGGVALGAAFPNPFHRSATLRFTVPSRSRATLRILDLAGRVVRTLVDAELEPGGHAIQWDSRDDRGAPVAGGTYFARLAVDGRTQSRAIVLVR